MQEAVMMPTANGPLNNKNMQLGNSEDDNDAASPDLSTSVSDSKKRRAPGSSSRGVANLTPEQLAKKRANDREAQRAIRERTKNQIESLEARIRELSSTQPFQELQHALRQKEAVEAENADIKKRLSSVMAILEPLLAQQNPNHDPALSLSQPYLPSRQNHPANMMSPHINIGSPSTPGGSGGPWHAPNGHMSSSESIMYQEQTKLLSQQRHDLTHGFELGSERLGLDFLLDRSQRKLMNNIRHESPDQESLMHNRSNSHSSNGHSIDFPIGNIGLGSRELIAHSTPIRNCPPTTPLDDLLLACLQQCQQQAQDGIPTPKLVGPAYPSVSSLLNPAQAVNSHPLSKVFTDIISTFPDIATLPNKVATLYIMFLIMRWQISPTQENYDRLPDWITPRPSQLFSPHPAWIDHVPWPSMRDKLVRDYPNYQFDRFTLPFTSTMSVNWPYEDTDTLLSVGVDAGTGEDLTINPVFERHLRRLENWSLGPAFAEAFPSLVGTYRLKSEP